MKFGFLGIPNFSVKQALGKEVSLTETSPSEIQARALCDIHFLLADISPLTCLSRELTEPGDDEDERKGTKFLN